MTLTLEPLLNYRLEERLYFGTVIDFCPIVSGFSSVKIGDWRKTHLDCSVSIAYGVSLTAQESKIIDIFNGRFLKIEGRGVTRFYWYAPGTVCGNVCWNQLLLPNRVIADYDENEEMTRQVHYLDFKWLELSYRTQSQYPVFTREELIAKAERKISSFYLECWSSSSI